MLTVLGRSAKTDDRTALDALAGELGCKLTQAGDLVIPYRTPFRAAARMIYAWAGRRWSLLLRTAISQIAEEQDGKRQGRRGHDNA